jgi:hypothetical protein
MTRTRRDSVDTVSHLRSHGTCFIACGMVGSLAAALLGLVFEQHAVWAASLACFALFCVQWACGYYWSRERSVVVVNIAVADRPLRTSTL